MMIRELSPSEWRTFFDCFSRRFRGLRVTLQLSAAAGAPPRTLANRLPLLGITVEPPHGPADSIQVMLGDASGQSVAHVIHQPSRVRVAQVSNGEDEMLIIDSAGGDTASVDFGSATRGTGRNGGAVSDPADADLISSSWLIGSTGG